MVFEKSIYVLLAAMAVVLIKAHEHSNGPHDDQRPEPSNNQRRPPFGFSFTPFSASSLPSFGFISNRDRRPESTSVDRPINGPGNPDVYRQVVGCNYTTHPGHFCISCDQTLFCSQLNYGVVNTCRGRRPHCNNGRCSRTQSEECSS